MTTFESSALPVASLFAAEPQMPDGNRAPRNLRVLIVAETFLPVVNGVTNSVLRVIENMTLRGHDVSVVAPGIGLKADVGVPVFRVKSFELPGYADLHIGRDYRELRRIIELVQPDVIHVASPALMGRAAITIAAEVNIPTVAIYQTDLAGFARRYRFGVFYKAVWRFVSKIHSRASLTLAPSTAAVWDLRQRGVGNVSRWMRGVDLERFNPQHRSEALRREWAPNNEVIVGFVGRLAREKQVELLAPISRMPGVKLVVVGDGPCRRKLQRLMPGALFLGFKSGAELGAHYASFDVFVHTGIDETFCQAVQEALASGVPVVGPAAGGPMDLVLHGVNGFLWNPESEVSLMGAVEELVRHPVKRDRIASQTRASVVDRTWASVMAELEGHYLSLVDGLEFAYSEMGQ